MRGGHNNYVWKKLRRDRAFIEQGGICPYCTLPMKREEATLEHIHPKCKHGSDEDKNLLAVHEWCNKTKADMWGSRFFRKINARGYSGDFHIDMMRVLRRLDKRTKKACKNIRRAVA